ncbi:MULTISPECIES: DUF5666 domain-containing protein [Mycobacterium]|uniref:DUF5666 domain-containing protein n=1 Tax=Mycobacterium kiyosense TaxID=2871094 RepID=A0A9P3Q831_9MYCO|nr:MULTISPECIES: DUF5666 domain-containing protein [Mycobacterium]BDB43060.1 hypothetical protein IWGMT90018_35060 [Mycobacterium kiyosense]BDE13731.1 hypothetical protein MKCMC460_25910 [Mycobacterium sp. 20KCMC460]GLB85500.1 hypothetical protein SRL2020028_47560 [Mycobacterium kiyosense]GLB89025.1 hypothetical protein SRL2020130_18420 [Mycobacterium kiyosense]GLB94371.1 hypothetical protein SRL2020226_11470 [Mycobacterium kiyosense]
MRGLIASVSGNAAQVTQQSGTTTVDFTDSTKVTEVTPGALTDVTAGSCITARSKEDTQPGSPITAASVRVSPAENGKCPEGKQAPTPSSTPSGTPSETPSGTPTTTTGPGKKPAVQGSVASVAGNTITVNTASGSQTVTVTDKTKYTKETAANSQAISAGKCLTARGSENNGALQATSISLQPAEKGKCNEGGGEPHHR